MQFPSAIWRQPLHCTQKKRFGNTQNSMLEIDGNTEIWMDFSFGDCLELSAFELPCVTWPNPTSHRTRSHYVLKGIVLVQDVVIQTITWLTRSSARSLLAGVCALYYITACTKTPFFRMCENEFDVMGDIKMVFSSCVFNASSSSSLFHLNAMPRRIV